jgi:predicted RNA-binding protein with PIN domain
MARASLPLLVVDGYNVIYGTPAYEKLIERGPRNTYTDPDPMERAREALVADVAAYAQRTYEAVIVYDGAGNVSPARPDFSTAGVKIIFSRTGESADSVIETLVTRAREKERKVVLVTSDNTVQASSGLGIARISAATIAHDFEQLRHETAGDLEDRTHAKMTLGSRLDAETRKKLDALRGKVR